MTSILAVTELLRWKNLVNPTVVWEIKILRPDESKPDMTKSTDFWTKTRYSIRTEEHSMKKILFLVSAILMIFNCSEERFLPLGNEGNQVIETVVLQPKDEDFFYPVTKNTGLSTHLLLGKYGEYTARILIKFDQFPDSAVVNSARIVLYGQSILGDSSTSFEANMYKIESDWNEDEVKLWTAPDLKFDSTTVISSVSIGASKTDSVTFILDPALVNQWADTSQADANNGIWIGCDDALFIKDFNSREASVNSPRLKLLYNKENQPSTTLTFSTVASHDVFILIPNLKLDDQSLYIGKGVAFHSLIKFDLEKHIDSTATINRADLELVINRDYSIFDAAGVSDLLVMRVTSESSVPQEIEIDSTFSGYSGTVLNDTVTVDVTSLVQQWTARNQAYLNQGFLLQSSGESLTLARTAFYSSQADSITAPKLLIKYTLPPSKTYY